MIAVWMLYAALWTLWLSCAAILVERIMLGARGPVRIVWFAAIVLSLFAPVVAGTASRLKPPPVPPAMSVVAATQLIPAPIQPPSVRRVEVPILPAMPAARTTTLSSIAARADRPLLVSWIVLSLGLCAYFAGGMLRLGILRRRWRSENVYGEPVLISDETGPALVGFVDPVIVIPAWALSLDATGLALMLRHEVEHRRAGDTRVLTLAQILVVLMPWNVALWWELRRLRLAIELDCDARVLAGTSDVGAYGRLLLEFGRARRGVQFAGTALVDHATDLEKRIRLMTKRARMPRGRAFVGSVIAGVVAIVVGCQLPAPEKPAPSTPRESRGPVVASVDSAPKSSVRDTIVRARASTDSLKTSRAAVRGAIRDSSTGAKPATIFVEPTTARDSLERAARVLQLFSTAIALDTVKDPAVRTSYKRTLNEFARQLDSVNREMKKRGQIDTTDYQRMLIARLDSVTRKLEGLMPVTEPQMKDLTRLLDSLNKLRRHLELTYTPDHPLMLENAHQIEQLQRQLGRVVDPFNPPISEPACSVLRSSGGSVVRLMISDDAAARGGKIVLTSEATPETGVTVEYDRPGPKCISLVPSEIRVYGRGMLEGTPVYVQSSLQTSVLVMSASGQVVAGPIALANEWRRYELAWARR